MWLEKGVKTEWRSMAENKGRRDRNNKGRKKEEMRVPDSGIQGAKRLIISETA